jgi:CsoR family transcriptional regulator, copper-sensing transcriptional repressor
MAKDEEACTACCRKTERPEELKKALDARLARIEGQARGIRRLIAEDAYCDDVLAQISAAQAALGKASLVVLEHHMKHCLIDRVRDGDDDIVDELVITLGRMI